MHPFIDPEQLRQWLVDGAAAVGFIGATAQTTEVVAKTWSRFKGLRHRGEPGRRREPKLCRPRTRRYGTVPAPAETRSQQPASGEIETGEIAIDGPPRSGHDAPVNIISNTEKHHGSQ